MRDPATDLAYSGIAEQLSRRDFIKRTGLVSLATIGGLGMGSRVRGSSPQTWPVPADGVARGTVFVDARGDGVRRGQRGLAGILVSNGVEIAVTDAHGRYELPVAAETILFVIKPRGYAVPLNANNLPQFYYIHHPAGSPDAEFLYKGIAPTGDLPDSVDFALREQSEADAFEVLLTADPQCYNREQLHWYSHDAVSEFADLPVACGIALGDIVGDHLDLYPHYNAINASCGFPWHNVIGNHDLNFMALEDRYAEETFKRIYGPTSYAFQQGPVHFIVLNNVFWEGYTLMRQDGWPRRGQYKGHLRAWQLQFVRNYLKHVPVEDRIVVCTHIPFVNIEEYSNQHTTPESRELLEILSSHPNTVSFSGHDHINMNFWLGAEHGYRPEGGGQHLHCNLAAVSGSWYRGPLDAAGIPIAMCRDGSPKGYAVVRFRGAGHYEICYKSIGLAETHQMRIHLPGKVVQAQLADTLVSVNVYHSSTRTQVRMRVDDGAWQTMMQAKTTDATYAALRARNSQWPEAGGGPLLPPSTTDHHWQAALPEGLDIGWHTLCVESQDPGCKKWIQRHSFVVVENHSELDYLDKGTRPPHFPSPA